MTNEPTTDVAAAREAFLAAVLEQDLERERHRRARRAAMTPDERQAHDAFWSKVRHAADEPASAATNAWFDAIIGGDDSVLAA